MDSAPIIIAAEAAGQAPAAAELLVRLTVMPSCGMRSAQDSALALLDFGEISTTASPIITKVDRESTNALTLRCSSRFATPLVAMNGGVHAEGDQRYLVNGPVRVGYDLFRDTSLSEPWQPGVRYPIALRLPDVPQEIGIYGRIPAPQQATAPGTYSDVVLVTLTY